MKYYYLVPVTKGASPQTPIDALLTAYQQACKLKPHEMTPALIGALQVSIQLLNRTYNAEELQGVIPILEQQIQILEAIITANNLHDDNIAGPITYPTAKGRSIIQTAGSKFLNALKDALQAAKRAVGADVADPALLKSRKPGSLSAAPSFTLPETKIGDIRLPSIPVSLTNNSASPVPHITTSKAIRAEETLQAYFEKGAKHFVRDDRPWYHVLFDNMRTMEKIDYLFMLAAILSLLYYVYPIGTFAHIPTWKVALIGAGLVAAIAIGYQVLKYFVKRPIGWFLESIGLPVENLGIGKATPLAIKIQATRLETSFAKVIAPENIDETAKLTAENKQLTKDIAGIEAEIANIHRALTDSTTVGELTAQLYFKQLLATSKSAVILPRSGAGITVGAAALHFTSTPTLVARRQPRFSLGSSAMSLEPTVAEGDLDSTPTEDHHYYYLISAAPATMQALLAAYRTSCTVRPHNMMGTLIAALENSLWLLNSSYTSAELPGIRLLLKQNQENLEVIGGNNQEGQSEDTAEKHPFDESRRRIREIIATFLATLNSIDSIKPSLATNSTESKRSAPASGLNSSTPLLPVASDQLKTESSTIIDQAELTAAFRENLKHFIRDDRKWYSVWWDNIRTMEKADYLNMIVAILSTLFYVYNIGDFVGIATWKVIAITAAVVIATALVYQLLKYFVKRPVGAALEAMGVVREEQGIGKAITTDMQLQAARLETTIAQSATPHNIREMAALQKINRDLKQQKQQLETTRKALSSSTKPQEEIQRLEKELRSTEVAERKIRTSVISRGADTVHAAEPTARTTPIVSSVPIDVLAQSLARNFDAAALASPSQPSSLVSSAAIEAYTHVDLDLDEEPLAKQETTDFNSQRT